MSVVKKGRLIVVEGLEGSGKSTAISTIQRMLDEYVPNVIKAREPGGTFVGEGVRKLIKDVSSGESLDPRAELLLFYAARVQLLQQVICPALDSGSWVLLDRFELSTLAYQGGGRKLDSVMLSHLSKFCIGDIKPDLVIFLDVLPEQGMKRVANRGKLDRIEQESLLFFYDVYKSYHDNLQKMDNVMMIDASKPLPVVQRLIREKLKHYLMNYATALT